MPRCTLRMGRRQKMPIKKGRKYEHFKSRKKYNKYEAYIHIHHVPHKHHKFVVIHGRKHKVKRR